MNVFSTLIQTLSSIITNPIYRALLLSTHGEWTDEVSNAIIVKFVRMGPKNYGYEFVDKDGNGRSTRRFSAIVF